MNSQVLQFTKCWRRHGNHSLSPALITKAHTEWKPPQQVFVRKALLGIFVRQLSACEPNSMPPLPPPVNCSRTVLVLANLCCHPHAIVIHVFIRLCTEKDKRVVGGGCLDGECWLMGGPNSNLKVLEEITALSCQRTLHVGQKYYITLLNTNPPTFVLQRPTDKIWSMTYLNGVLNDSL